jgi:hypothetical protein
VIRHVVSWKLKAEEDEAKANAAAEIIAAFDGLESVIPELIALAVSRDVTQQAHNHDLVLVADFASLDDLEAYQVHPAHIRAVGVVGARVSARACVDFEV